jgi:hypothetical protein
MLNFITGLSSKVFLIIIGILLTLNITQAASIWFKNISIDNLKSKIIEFEYSEAQSKLNIQTLTQTIIDMNTEIEKQKIDYDAKLKVYQEWKSNGKYQTIIKEVKSNECKDIKNIIDNIRNLSF